MKTWSRSTEIAGEKTSRLRQTFAIVCSSGSILFELANVGPGPPWCGVRRAADQLFFLAHDRTPKILASEVGGHCLVSGDPEYRSGISTCSCSAPFEDYHWKEVRLYLQPLSSPHPQEINISGAALAMRAAFDSLVHSYRTIPSSLHRNLDACLPRNGKSLFLSLSYQHKGRCR